MDDAFNNLLGLIPIALFIAYRIIMARRKQAEARQKRDDEPPMVQPAREVRPAVTSAYQDEDEEPEFSAWNLSANDPPPPPVAPEPPRIIPHPEAMAILPSFAEPEPFVPEDTGPKLAGIVDAPPARPSFPDNLAYLPPLKRALVLAEILGPPKSQIL